MYGIFTYICLKFMVTVGKYSIHRAYGISWFHHPTRFRCDTRTAKFLTPLRWGPGLEKTETPERRGVREAQFIGEMMGCFLGSSVALGLSPFPVIVTTRIITFLVGNPYKPSFQLLLGRGTTQGSPISLLSQCLTFKLFGIAYLIGKTKFNTFISGSIGWVSKYRMK